MSDNPKVAIVGYGKVGRVLARALPAAGWEVAAVVTRQEVQNAECRVLSDIADLPGEVGLVILCLRDREIERVARLIPNSKLQTPNFLCHTAGALSAEILAPAREKGWSVMSWHPLQTFTGDEPPAHLKGVTFGIDGDAEAVETGERLARDLGGLPFRVPPELRRAYHLGGVFACNLMAALVAESLDLLKEVGMEEARALQALEPLLLATVRNIARKGLPEAITGPVRRGDAATVAGHLEVLKGKPEAEEIYRLLSLALLKRLHGGEELKKVLLNTENTENPQRPQKI